MEDGASEVPHDCTRGQEDQSSYRGQGSPFGSGFASLSLAFLGERSMQRTSGVVSDSYIGLLGGGRTGNWLGVGKVSENCLLVKGQSVVDVGELEVLCFGRVLWAGFPVNFLPAVFAEFGYSIEVHFGWWGCG